MNSLPLRAITNSVYAVIILLALTLSACRNNEVIIPYTDVNFTIDLNDPEFYNLRVVGNALEVTGGVNGIIIFRQNIDTDTDFVAYDKTCTNDPNFGCKTQLSPNNYGYAICECCQSEFNLYGGYFETGPAVYPLKTYSVHFNPNTEILTVSNF